MSDFIYLDNAATTKPCGEALNAFIEASCNDFGNPSSSHKLGLKQKRVIDTSKEILLNGVGGAFENVVFTSGATEANNLAILGARKKKNSVVVTNKAEHASVLETYKKLNGCETAVLYIPLNNCGEIDQNKLEESINEKTDIVSIMHVNNETGVIQDIEKIGKTIKSINPKTLFHVDCVQSFGKIDIKPQNIDLLTMSAHKIHAFKGSGALLIKKGVTLNPIFYGGLQQNKIRPGTENTGGIYSFAKALEFMQNNKNNFYEHVLNLNNTFLTEINEIENIKINSVKNVSPYILNVSFIGVKSQIMLNYLNEKNIFVSAGSSCHSSKIGKNVLSSYGLSDEISDSSIRFSFSFENTIEEILKTAEILKEAVPFLRKYSKV